MREEMCLGRQEAFEIFKRDHADSVIIDDNKQILKQRFSEAKALGESINETRNKIGQLKDAITQRHLQQVALGHLFSLRDDKQCVQGMWGKHDGVPGTAKHVTTGFFVTAEVQTCRVQLRYKTTFMRLKALKVEIEHLQLLMDKAKVKLQKEFDVWWAEEATSLQVNSPATNPQEGVQPVPQQDQPQRLSKKSSEGWEVEDGADSLDVCISERSMSSIPLTGDSQTDSDILAFIKARQSILQKK
ncbi:hypothetical protein STEG23_017468, partial [Scotinomys teguina]